MYEERDPVRRMLGMLKYVIPLAVLVGIITGVFLILFWKDSGEPAVVSSLPPKSSTDAAPASVDVPVVQSEAAPPSVPEAPSKPEPSSEPEPKPEPEPDVEEAQPEAAVGFLEQPTVSVSGTSATVTYKTGTSSTVNAILTTSGEAVGVRAFYDYFSRGQALEGAVGKAQTFNVNDAGISQSFTLPESGKTYYLLVNVVDNATEQWQDTISVILLR